MTLARKTFLIIGFTIVVLIILLYAMCSNIVNRSFSRLEENEVREDVHRVLEAFYDDVDKVNFTARDWSNWDDTYNYIEDHNEKYVKADLNINSLTLISMNIVVYLDSSGQTVFATGIDLEGGEEVSPPKSFLDFLASHPAFIKHEDVQSVISGILVLPEGPLIVASRPILTSQSKGPIRGTLIFGRFYNKSMVEALARRTHFSIDFRTLDSKALPNDFQNARLQLSEDVPVIIQPLNSKLIAGYALIRDVDKKPVLILRVEIPRNIYEEGQASLRYLMMSLLIVGIVFLILTLILLTYLVLSRLRRFVSVVTRVRKSGDLSIRVPENKKDELGQLANAFNEMLEEIEKSSIRFKKTDEYLLQSQKMDAMGRLAGGIAHDFNNLLTAIIGYSDLLLKNIPEGDPMYQDLSEIKNAGERAAVLTRQLLAFGRKQVLESKVICLNQVISDIEKMFRRLVSEHIDLVFVLDKELGVVRADSSQIEQVLVNLLLNARDAMPEGGKLIIETANIFLDETYTQKHTEVKPGPYVMLAVSDTGTGIDKDTLTHVFEPFYSTKEIGKGTGLGLSAVYGIVKQSGGNIFIYSETGLGTTVKIYLPCVAEETDGQEVAKPVVNVFRGKETILLVEDEAVVRKLAHEILQRQGYTVLEASNGGEALMVSEKHKGDVHLLLTDVVMPKMNGYELSDRLGQIRPKMKVIYMSGYTDHNLIPEQMLKRGAIFIQKPFTPEILIHRLREALD